MNNLYIAVGGTVVVLFLLFLFFLRKQKNDKQKEEVKRMQDLKEKQSVSKKTRYSPVQKNSTDVVKKQKVNFKVLPKNQIDENKLNQNIMQGIQDGKDIDDMDLLNMSIQNGDKNLGVFVNVNRDSSLPYVLIVDDSRTALRSAVDALKDHFEIETAKDGLEALEKMKERVPDLIVSDVEMPRLNGFELVERIKNSLEFSHIPIIIITGHLEYHFDTGIDGGVSSLINKPYNKEDLLYEAQFYVNQ